MVNVEYTPFEDSRVFDPQRDEPPVNPTLHGTRLQADWHDFLLLGQLWAHNVRTGRGASLEDRRAFGIRAGGENATTWGHWKGIERDSVGNTWLTEEGQRSLRHFAGAVGVELPPDVSLPQS